MLSSSRGIPFRNDSGQTIPAYGVMRIAGLTVVEGMPVLTVNQPDASFHRSFLVNGPIDVPASGAIVSYGTAQGGGYPLFALYDGSTLPPGQSAPQLGDHWGVDSNSWKLCYGREGFYGLGGSYGNQASDDGSGGETAGTLRTIVRPYEIRQVVARLTASLASGGSATATLQKFAMTSTTLTYADTSITSVTVYDGGFLQSGSSLSSGTLVVCQQVLASDKLLVIQASQCPG